MEKIYKTMRNTGAASIAVGVIVASVGLAAGIIAIVNGALLLKRKSEITFSSDQGGFNAAVQTKRAVKHA